MDEMSPSIKFFADYILKEFNFYHDTFKLITRRAGKRFMNEDWQGYSSDVIERLNLYGAVVNKSVSKLTDLLKQNNAAKAHWQEVKNYFAATVNHREDSQLSKTFFNSIARRIFNVVGVDPEIEFTTEDFEIPLHEQKHCKICTAYSEDWPEQDMTKIAFKILSGFRKKLSVSNIEQDAIRVSNFIIKSLQKKRLPAKHLRVEMLDTVFYRYKEAYLIGRIIGGKTVVPLVFCLLNIEGRIFVDAVLLSESEVSILFSFAHAYFHVEVQNLWEMVIFLKSIIPQKRISEIFNSLGYHKHGKAELYRELIRNLENSKEKFEIARGEKGMVMLVFTIPSFDVVFKIIKDHFDEPKKTTPEFIKHQYKFVFNHDRVGRLVDIQEFEYLEFDRSSFSDHLIRELSEKAKNNIIVTDEHIIIKHLYTQRRLFPLDLYIDEKPPQTVKSALIDYGWAIKELAASNIFPGDLFFKNFGVTRHGRIVFYDYDELSLLLDCDFKKLPTPGNYNEMMSDEAWFPVYPNDVFPEEFTKFLHFPAHVDKAFKKIHGDLLNVEFWQNLQNKIRSNTSILILPYKQKSRLPDQFPDNSGYYLL